MTTPHDRTPLLTSISSIFLITVMIIIFIRYYIAHEEPLYYWDYSGYWDQYKSFGTILSSNAMLFLSALYRSIDNNSYGAFPIAPLMPFYLLFGGSRTSYILSTSILYLLPAALIATRLAYISTINQRKCYVFYYFSLLLAILYTPFWAPTLRGYISIGGLIPLGLAVIIIIKSEYLTRSSLKEAALIGALLYASFLFRRWYAPSVIAIVISTIIYSSYAVIANKNNTSITALVKRYFILFMTGTTLGLIFQHNLLLRIIKTNYSSRYAAYSAPFSEILYNIYSNIGLYVVSLILIGTLYSIYNKKIEKLFLLFVAFITLAIFSLMQAPGLQQQLPIVFFLFPLYVTGVYSVYSLFKNGNYYIIASALVAIFIFASSFLPSRYIVPYRNAFFTPSTKYLPLTIGNFRNYELLDSKLLSVTSGGDKFSVFAASGLLNSSLLVAINNKLGKRINWESDIDARDHFHWSTLASKYIVVGVPIQLQFPKKFQRVIYIPAHDIIDHIGIGKFYEKIGHSFVLAGNIKAYIYKRKTRLTADAVRNFANQFYKHYPSWKKYDNNRISMRLVSANISLGKKWGYIDSIAKNEIFMSPGIDSKTSLSFSISGYNKRFIMADIPSVAMQDCKDTHGVIFNFLADGREVLSKHLVPGEKISCNIPSYSKVIKLIVSPVRNPNCDWVHVRFVNQK